VFWVISVYFNIRNTLPKFCPFLLAHPVYTSIIHSQDVFDSIYPYKIKTNVLIIIVKNTTY